VALALATSLAGAAQAGVRFTTLAAFGGTNGYDAQANLVQAGDGNFYGTTTYGGYAGGTNSNYGTLFRITPAGTLTSLFSFGSTNGSDPSSGLMQAQDGKLYGGSYSGGAIGGAVFQMTTNGVFTNLVSFSFATGWGPLSRLIQAFDGNLYGTTSLSFPGAGTVFRVTTNGSLVSLASFATTNGAKPTGALLQGADGYLYGTTFQGGTNGGYGTVFKAGTNGGLDSLVSFASTNGATPNGGLVWGLDGNLYGTTTGGGTANVGTVFKVTTAGVLSSLYSFSTNGSGGYNPHAGLTLGADGKFYGTTYNGGSQTNGTIFSVTPDGNVSFLFSFTNQLTGGSPDAGLTVGTDGNFYGVTTTGGAQGYGTVFRIGVPMAPAAYAAAQVGNSFVCSWKAVAGQTYQPEFSTALDGTGWTSLGNPILATNGTASVSDPLGANTQRFYRVHVLP